MARWFPAHNYTPAADYSLQAVVPDGGDYTDLVTGDMALVYFNDQVNVFVYDSTNSDTENIPRLVTSDGNAGNGRWVKTTWAPEYKNGVDTQISPPADSTLSFVDGTRTLSITPTGASFDFYVDGSKYTQTGAGTIVITDVEGQHLVAYDDTGTLVVVANPTGDQYNTAVLTQCMIAIIEWDAVNKTAIVVQDERHGANMNPATHLYLHHSFGAQYDSGLGFTNFDIDGAGNDATAAQFDVANGEIHDEDIEVDIEDGSPQQLVNATIPTYYKLGAGALWRKIEATAGYPVADGTIGDRLDWNDENGGTWQLQEVTDGNYVLTHYFATNDIYNPIIGIMGQAVYGNINGARLGAETELASTNLDGLVNQEYVAIASVIWQTADAYGNQVAARIRSTDTGDDYIDWREVPITAAGSTASNHEGLAGLLGGAAADHYHLTSAQETDLTDGGQTDLHKHNTIDFGVLPVIQSTADGIDILDSSGTTPTVVFQNDGGTPLSRFSADATTLYTQLWNGSSYEDAVKSIVNGGVELYFNNLKSFTTTAFGVIVYDTDGSSANVELRDSAAAVLSNINSTATTTRLTLGSGAEDAWTATLNGAVNLYFNDLKAMTTSGTGIHVHDTSGNEPYVNFYTDADVLVGTVNGSATDFFIKGRNHGSNLRLQQEDAGGALCDILHGDPDGAVTLYYDDTSKMVTHDEGITVDSVLKLLERATDPTEPGEGEAVIWMSDGTGKGDDGDVMIASKAGGTTNFTTLFDHSGGAAW